MQKKLKEYAKLVVRIGVNIQKGQKLVIDCPVDCAYFARLLAEEAYDAGAREVAIRWKDEFLTRMKYLRADDAVFDEVPEWLVTQFNGYAKERAALVGVISSDPELLQGVDPDRIRRSAVAVNAKLKRYSDQQINNEFQWCGVSVPSVSWAKKVFPGKSDEEAVQFLWDAIFKTVHVGGDGAVDIWTEKVSSMARRAQILTEYHFTELIYHNALGTDLTIGLPEGHMWVSCGEKAATGAEFVANMPTEEIFTLPKRDSANGVLYASKPLSLNGNIINDIILTFQNGRIIKAEASSGLDVLENELNLDEGARYLGEVALVPFHSPINEMNILFYNALFDENASCHFAFGKAYPAFTDRTLTEEQKQALGANDSAIHVDFMVGTADLSITGVTKDGNKTPVFVNGDFVI